MRENSGKSGLKGCVTAIVAILMLLGIGVLLYCEWRGSLWDTLYVCRKMLWVMPLFADLAWTAHYHAGKGMGSRQYISQLFCGKAVSGGRRAYLDYARVFAAVMVILTHACSMQANEDAAAWKINLLLVCTGIGLVCNPLYVMISGALLLSAEREEALGAFYFKRFVKVVIPMAVYYVIFLCVSGQMSLIPPRNLREGFLRILGGASGIVPHYWLIYTLISLYVTAPFIRVMVQNLKDSQITVLFFLILYRRSTDGLSAVFGSADRLYVKPGKLGGGFYLRLYSHKEEDEADGAGCAGFRGGIRGDCGIGFGFLQPLRGVYQ